MKEESQTVLVTEIARDVLTEIAPQELSVFVPASRAFFANPQAVIKQTRSTDASLGFGADPFIVYLTPVVLHVLNETYKFLIEVAKKAVADELAKETPDIIRGMFKKFSTTKVAVHITLTPEQLELVHANAILAATRLRLSPDKAKALANAITTQLVLPEE
ncbi:hypothetical protein [Caballeronia ptereochthonis]|uniref:Uncharacterized protein n=1 Tax=Caballeronia ptereochthonis TaxID=1777144 RepID=A0A158DYF1_9BURK|nr:hypothetical protein [Caballeronia ptereochthonis]SAK99584.1 hypothetical protein AWB83_06105 [Caballeronia ptereochthonis]